MPVRKAFRLLFFYSFFFLHTRSVEERTEEGPQLRSSPLQAGFWDHAHPRTGICFAPFCHQGCCTLLQAGQLITL